MFENVSAASATERAVIAQLRRLGRYTFTEHAPKPNADFTGPIDPECLIRAEVLAAAIRGFPIPDMDDATTTEERLFRYGVCLQGAWIEGTLNLRDLNRGLENEAPALRLEHCFFNGDMTATPDDMTAGDDMIVRDIDLRNAHVALLSLKGSRFVDFVATNARINGSVDFSNVASAEPSDAELEICDNDTERRLLRNLRTGCLRTQRQAAFDYSNNPAAAGDADNTPPEEPVARARCAIDLGRAIIGGGLRIRHAELACRPKHGEIDVADGGTPYALNVAGADIADSVALQPECVFHGGMTAQELKLAGPLWCTGTKLSHEWDDRALRLPMARIGASVTLGASERRGNKIDPFVSVGTIDMYGAQIGHELFLAGGQLFAPCDETGQPQIDQTAISIYQAAVSGHVRLTETTSKALNVNGRIAIQSSRIAGNIELAGDLNTDAIFFNQTECRGSVEITLRISPKPVVTDPHIFFSGCNFESNLTIASSFQSLRHLASIDLANARVNGSLKLIDLNVNQLEARSIKIGGDVQLTTSDFRNIDLENATVGGNLEYEHQRIDRPQTSTSPRRPRNTSTKKITAAQSIDLPFYDGHTLIAALATSAESEIESMQCFLWNKETKNILAMDGTSPPLHQFNASGGLTITKENALAYLAFFTGQVWGEEGPFIMAQQREQLSQPLKPNDNSDLVVGDDQNARLPPQRIADFLRPDVSQQADNTITVTGVAIIYAGHMFSANFRIMPSGMVEMLDDDPIAELASPAKFHYEKGGLRKPASGSWDGPDAAFKASLSAIDSEQWRELEPEELDTFREHLSGQTYDAEQAATKPDATAKAAQPPYHGLETFSGAGLRIGGRCELRKLILSERMDLTGIQIARDLEIQQLKISTGPDKLTGNVKLAPTVDLEGSRIGGVLEIDRIDWKFPAYDDSQIRTRPLLCYPGWWLVEARETGDGDTSPGPVGIRSYLWRPRGRGRDGDQPGQVRLLDGTSPPVHMMNAEKDDAISRLGRPRLLLNHSTAREYLYFFTSHVWGEEGPFRIATTQKELQTPITEAMDGLKTLTWANNLHLHPTTRTQLLRWNIRRARDADSKSNITQTRYAFVADGVPVIYASHLFSATFGILESGMIEMIEDTPIAEFSVKNAIRYRNGLRYFEPDNENTTENPFGKREVFRDWRVPTLMSGNWSGMDRSRTRAFDQDLRRHRPLFSLKFAQVERLKDGAGRAWRENTKDEDVGNQPPQVRLEIDGFHYGQLGAERPNNTSRPAETQASTSPQVRLEIDGFPYGQLGDERPNNTSRPAETQASTSPFAPNRRTGDTSTFNEQSNTASPDKKKLADSVTSPPDPWEFRREFLNLQYDYETPISLGEFDAQPYEHLTQLYRKAGRSYDSIEIVKDRIKHENRLRNDQRVRDYWPSRERKTGWKTALAWCFLLAGLGTFVLVFAGHRIPVPQWMGQETPFALVASTALTITTGALAVIAAALIGPRIVDWIYRNCFGYGLELHRALIVFVLLLMAGSAGTFYMQSTDILVLDETPVETRREVGLPSAETALQRPRACHDNINTFLYTVDVFVPLIDLRHEIRCRVAGEHTFWRWLAALYALLGWIVTSLTILTATGVIRRRAEG